MIGDIQEMLEGAPSPSKEKVVAKTPSRKSVDGLNKRPEKMHRELYALISDKTPQVAPIVPSYKTSKAKLGLKHVRQWKWTPFKNPAREDTLELTHWMRSDKLQEPYPFVKFNKTLDCPEFSDVEYSNLLGAPGWTKAETHHLLALCKQFDLRWPVILDRWDREKFPQLRSMEDMKERYYNICNAIIKSRCNVVDMPQIFCFDAEGERKRKAQLDKLWNRTEEQIEEEEQLLSDLRTIQARRKERERKAQDLQKLITAADRPPVPTTPGPLASPAPTGSVVRKKQNRGVGRPSNSSTSAFSLLSNLQTSAGLKFPELRGAGPHLRSQRLKLQVGIGQKKMKAIEQAIDKLHLDWNPMPTDEICVQFNQLRSDIGVLFELKSNMSILAYDLASISVRHMEETGEKLEIPEHLRMVAADVDESNCSTTGDSSTTEPTPTTTTVTPTRKRKAAIEQSIILRKMRKS